MQNETVYDNCNRSDNISISVKDGSNSRNIDGNNNDNNNNIGIKCTDDIVKMISNNEINEVQTFQKATKVTENSTTMIKASRTNQYKMQLSLINNDTKQGTGPRSSSRALGYLKTQGDDMGRVDRGWSDADQALFSKASKVDREW